MNYIVHNIEENSPFESGKIISFGYSSCTKQFHDRILLVRDLCIYYDFTGKQGLTHCLLNIFVSITKFQISHFFNPVLSLETIPKLKRNFLAKNFVRPHRGSQVNVWCLKVYYFTNIFYKYP